jgi:hypothetical protein
VQEVDHSERAAAWREHVLRHKEDRNREWEELKDAGLFDEELLEQGRPSDEELRDGIGWPFSLDYDEWWF